MFIIDILIGVFFFFILLGFVKGLYTIYQWYLDHKEFQNIIKERKDDDDIRLI